MRIDEHNLDSLRRIIRDLQVLISVCKHVSEYVWFIMGIFLQPGKGRSLYRSL